MGQLDVQAIQSGLLRELAGSQARLTEWLEESHFDSPERRAVHDPTFKTWPLHYVATIATHFMTRLAWNLHAIQVLCHEELAVQAQPILRAVIESTIDLRYISTNPQTLITKWCLFEEVQRYKFWRGQPASERPKDYGFAERSVEKRLRLLDRHQPKSSGKPWRLRELSRDWDLSDLRHRDESACADLGEPEQELHDIYKLLCGNLHGGTEAANDFVIAHGDGRFELVSGLGRRKLVFVPFFCLYSLDVAVRAASRCGARGCAASAPAWDGIPATASEMAAAASADFAHQPASNGASA